MKNLKKLLSMIFLASQLVCLIRHEQPKALSRSQKLKIERAVKTVLKEAQTRSGKRKLFFGDEDHTDAFTFTLGALGVAHLIKKFGLKNKQEHLKKLSSRVESQRVLIEKKEQKTSNFLKTIEMIVEDCEDKTNFFRLQVKQRVDDFQIMTKGKSQMISGNV